MTVANVPHRKMHISANLSFLGRLILSSVGMGSAMMKMSVTMFTPEVK